MIFEIKIFKNIIQNTVEYLFFKEPEYLFHKPLARL